MRGHRDTSEGVTVKARERPLLQQLSPWALRRVFAPKLTLAAKVYAKHEADCATSAIGGFRWAQTGPAIASTQTLRSEAPALRTKTASARPARRNAGRRFLKPLGPHRVAVRESHQRPASMKSSHRKRAVTTDIAFRHSQYSGNSAQFWLHLQAEYELRRGEREGELPKIRRCSLLAAA